MFESVKNFYKKHKKKILTGLGIFGACAAGGAVGYCLTRDWSESKNDIVENETEELIEQEDPCAWKKEYDDDMYFLELAARQMEHTDGYSWIVAGPNSYYNDDANTIDIYMVDNDGCYHKKPDDEEYYFVEKLKENTES